MNPKQQAIWNEVRERDSESCVLCGAQGAEIHHIIPRSRCKEEDLWKVQNMAVTCWECHHNGRVAIEARAGEIIGILVDRYPEYEDWYAERPQFNAYLGE
ncbi:MAG: HNH endonuclease [Sphaerochaeta sp.]|jgi:5-methylcytosine-specific restriction endonuclease McrA|nr:HNH endonuclease [Sphaerochaeta sp.]